MKIHFIVHDGVMEVGHTRAMMEVLRVLASRDEVEKIKLICYHADPPEKLIPNHPHKVEITTIPGGFLKPFLLKSLFFQIYTWIFKSKLVDPSMPIITMGVCSFIGNLVNIQFYHQDWEPLYFKYNKGPWYKNLYKAILLRYLSKCEDFYFNNSNLKFVMLSEFITKSLAKKYQLKPSQYTTAYSSVNFQEFLPPQDADEDFYHHLKSELIQKYPVLQNLNPSRPTLLFIGAFERKGLPFLLHHLPKEVDLIIVGKGEAHSSFSIPEDNKQLFHIPYTTEISKFYLLADAFIFPTHYEPFGLVVTEAVASGCQVFVSKEKVGASEIVKDMPGVAFINDDFQNQLTSIRKLDMNTRHTWALARKEQLSHYTWELCAQKWWDVITC